MKEDTQSSSQGFIQALYDHTVEDNWNKPKSHLNDTMAANIPMKMTSTTPTVSPDRKTGSTRNIRGQDVLQIGRPSSQQRNTLKWVKRARVKHINTRIIGGLMDGGTKPFGGTWTPSRKTALAFCHLGKDVPFALQWRTREGASWNNLIVSSLSQASPASSGWAAPITV